MRENGLQAANRPGRPRSHDGTIIPESIDTMWVTDMTAAFTVEHGQVAVFVAVDHCSAECVGIQRAQQQSAPAAQRTLSGDSGGPLSTAPGTKHWSRSGRGSPSTSAASRRTPPAASPSATIPSGPAGPASFGDRIKGLLAFDGSQYMSRDFQREIAWLGATSSPAFIRAPEGNGCAERFIRTLKENLLWIRTFRTVEERRLALIDFRRTYNELWLIERHGHRSPAQFRRDQMGTIQLAA